MKIAVFGTGGVGAYFGGRLAQAGNDVTFIARGDHLQKIQESGLKVDSIEGDFLIRPASATDDPASAGQVNVVLLGVKAWQVTGAAEAMRPMIGAQTFVVPLQNGVEAPAQLAAVLGDEHVVGGLCGLMAYLVGPGHVRHAGIEPMIKFGELDNRESKRVEALRDLFSAAKGVRVEVPADIEAALWQKFLFVHGWGAVGAVTRAPVGVLRALAETRQMIRLTIEEMYRVAVARGVALSPEIIDKTMALVDGLPESGTASMQRDIMDSRPSELDMQTGAVVRLGEAAGVDTPLNRFIYHSLLPAERGARGLDRGE